MSKIMSLQWVCPTCQTTQDVTLFESINLDRIPQQLPHLMDGSFERQTCGACASTHRPEHGMLLTWPSRRVWLVMMPRETREQFGQIEQEVDQRFAREWVQLPAVVKPLLGGVTPQLVFGQPCLSERLRVIRSGLEVAEVECVKLLLYRRCLPQLFKFGPVELLVERFRSTGLTMGVYELKTLHRRLELEVSQALFDEVRATRETFRQLYPSLFERAYASASRCLFG